MPLYPWPGSPERGGLPNCGARDAEPADQPGLDLRQCQHHQPESGDPETERRIIEAVSYGRQLGRMMDAVAVLIAQADPGSLTSEQRQLTPDRARALDGFWAVMAAVQDAKAEATSRWLSEEGMSGLADQLKQLRETDPRTYAKLANILSAALRS